MTEPQLNIGTDEWVASHEERTSGRRLPSWAGPLLAVPVWVYALVGITLAALVPVVGSSYVIRVGVNLGLMAMLALGLNLVVGYAGLLDLGYVAFYGFGAYAFAILSSEKFGLHWPTLVVVPIVVAAACLLGLLLGLPSRRLLGDYLAIVTLFFGQVFVQFIISGDRISVPGREDSLDLTGGANGVSGVDRFSFFGLTFSSDTWYYYLLLAIVVLLVIGIHRVDRSRIGRAWRAAGQDPLAAEAMTIPVNRLKILAFVVGAGIAGLAGTIFAAVQRGAYPSSFEVQLLILVYAAVILGGAGSLAGTLIGATIIGLLPELLRSPAYSEWIFLVTLVIVLVALLRSVRLGAIIAVATAVVGFVMNGVFLGLGVAGMRADAWTDGLVSQALGKWLYIPVDRTFWGNIGFVTLLVLVGVATKVPRKYFLTILPLILWLAMFVWYARLAPDPSLTRQLILGGLLVVMMIVRPNGLLGRRQVEVL